MPARRKKRRVSKKPAFTRELLKYLVFVLLIFAPFLYVRFTREFWDGENKLVIVTQKGGSGVVVSVLDPTTDEIVNISIPENTQVEVASQLGVWRVGSVWELGINEGKNGKLLADTVTKNFKFPVVAWLDTPGSELTSSSPAKIFKAIIYPYRTNLKVGDRVAVGLFSLGVKNPKRVYIDLENTGYLKETRFVDGSGGYEISGSAPQKLLALFADSEISKLGFRVIIRSNVGDVAVEKEVGEIIEVVGAKVASIIKEDGVVQDCIVRSKDKDIAIKFARVFSCEVDKGEFESGFDLEIAIGKGFAERF